jgi:glycosyltransferase involved in cell wall biosynthesis
MGQMKILIVCQYFHPEPFRITDIARELHKRGHVVTVLTAIPNYPKGEYYSGYGLLSKRTESLDGVLIRRAFVAPRGNGKAISIALNYISFAVSAMFHAFMTRKGEYDVVMVYQLSPVTMALPGAIAAARAGAPLVMYVVDLWPESLMAAGGIKKGMVISCFGRLVDWLYRRSDRILVTSNGFLEAIRSRGHRRKKIVYIPQYPEAVYRPAISLEDDPIRSEIPQGFIVIFTGNIGAAQGLSTVLDAATILAPYDDIHWIFIGDGRAKASLEKSIISRGLDSHVHLLGKRDMASIPRYLALSDIALVSFAPEPLFELTLPAKLQSYLACGMPIIGSVNGETAQVIIKSRAGLVSPAGDSEALAENVLCMYKKNPDELSAFSKNALDYFSENFSKEQLIGAIESNLLQATIKVK